MMPSHKRSKRKLQRKVSTKQSGKSINQYSQSDHHTNSDYCGCLSPVVITLISLVGLLAMGFIYTFYIRSTVKRSFSTITKDIIPTRPIVYRAQMLTHYSHGQKDFTQGLEFMGDNLIESTGLYGQSRVQILKWNSHPNKQGVRPVVLGQHQLDKRYFGEGITVCNGQIYLLTWKENTVFVYDVKSDEKNQFELTESRRLSVPKPMREGWGLAYADDRHAFYSTDGSSSLFTIDPETFKVINQIHVTEGTDSNHERRKVLNLNEIEYVNGWILANVWFLKYILIIDPSTGYVHGHIDCAHLFPVDHPSGRDAVLNGIALHKQKGQLLVTGKLWPKMFLIEPPCLLETPPPHHITTQLVLFRKCSD